MGEPKPLRTSVVITAWNAERFVADAIDSVLAQSRPAEEVIVNDDGSTDGTLATLGRYEESITVLTGPHLGTSAGRNRALAVATGEVIALLDADDLWLPTKLEQQLALLEAHPEVEAVFTGVDEFVDRAADDGAAPARPAQTGITGPLASTLAARRSLVDRVGPFDETLAIGDWMDWWARATAAEATTATVPTVLARRRLHAHNSTLRRDAATSGEYLSIVRRRLEARRSAP